MMRRQKKLALIMVVAFALSMFGGVAMAADKNVMVLSTTTSTFDSGLLDYIVPIFEEANDVQVDIISVGSGAAIQMGKDGDADVLLVHSRAAEDAFIAEDFGINRQDVMYNQFLIVGPADDPAQIVGTSDVAAAFAAIAENGTFVSRGDQSGTHTRELGIWPKAEVKLEGQSWYIEAGQGMGATLTMADEKAAYTLIDEATWLSWQDKVSLVEAVKGDPLLLNPYGLIEVNPKIHPHVNNAMAHAFVEFMISEEGQKLIGDFGKEKYGKGLFVPDAKKAEAVTTPITPVVVPPTPPVVTAPTPVAGENITSGEDAGISIMLDGAMLKTLDAFPYIQNGRTMVPIRFISEDLGAEVGWDHDSSTVTIDQSGKTIILTIGSATAYVNGSAVALEAAAELFNNRTMVPIRFVAEALGCTVDWYEEGSTVIIQSAVDHSSGI